tara:strand:- start:119 stop:412 length:294 start_codon:yes stop_codon:yes gene_type:complete
MKLFDSLKKRKFLLFNIFFTLYICINFVGGERGLISYLDKKKTYKELTKKSESLTVELKDLDHKISLINKNDVDYIDMLYRKKFNYVTEDEIIIKIK